MAVVGLGYVGLPTGLALARVGNSVVGIDTSTRRIDDIRNVRVDLVERDRLELAAALAADTIVFSTCADHLDTADVVLICVPTPVDDRHEPLLEPVASACAAVVEHAHAGQTIILTSTSFSGTTRRYLIEPLEAAGFVVGRDVYVAFSPERVDPGNARYTQDAVPRVVGGATEACADRARHALEPIAASIHVVGSPEVAELSKLFENTFRAVNIALANELADVCDRLHIDPIAVIDAASTKPYGFMPFFPGPGVGGHCIPVDPHYLLWQLRGIGAPAPVIDGAMREIAARPARMVERATGMLRNAGVPVASARVLVVGLTYKRDVRDLRGSPALEIIRALQGLGASVCFFDPLAEGDRACAELDVDPAPDPRCYDLVVVHTLHQSVDYRWIHDAPRVLDCTFRLGRPVLQVTRVDVAEMSEDGVVDDGVVDDGMVAGVLVAGADADESRPLATPRVRRRRCANAVKRAFDVTVSFGLLAITLPLLFVIAIAIKLESRGPVFYRCLRVGFGGCEFPMLKFRKMHDDATGPGLTVANDPRFTRVGRFLAVSKLDELPQLWNVVKGEMSIVGPRPESPEFVAMRPAVFAAVLQQVRPGITGPSQLAFAREGELLARDDSHDYYVNHLLPAKLAIDTHYAEAHTLRLDLRLLWWTAAAVFLRSPLAVDRSNFHVGVRHRPPARINGAALQSEPRGGR